MVDPRSRLVSMALIDDISGLEYEGLQWASPPPRNWLQKAARRLCATAHLAFQLQPNFLRRLFRTLLAQGSRIKEQLRLWLRLSFQKCTQGRAAFCAVFCINTWMSLRRIIGAHVKGVKLLHVPQPTDRCRPLHITALKFRRNLNNLWIQSVSFYFLNSPLEKRLEHKAKHWITARAARM